MERNLAVLIDFENVAAGSEREGMGRFDVGLIMDRFKEKGRILVARSYADWGRFGKFKQAMLREGVNLYELPAHGMGDKNRADIAMVVDCMELAFTKSYVDTFVVVSGDSDFTPLVTKLKELNKRVIGCGTRRSTSKLIVEACDEFIYYDSLVTARGVSRRQRKRGVDHQGVEAQPMSKDAVLALLTETLTGLQGETSKPVHASVLKEAMLRKEPAFSENELGYNSYAKFLFALRDAGIVVLTKDQKGGGYQVDLPGNQASSDEEPGHNERTRSTADALPGSEFGLIGRPLELYQILRDEGLEPTTPHLRGCVIREALKNIADRVERNRRATVQWVAQDVTKQLRGTPDALANRQVRAVMRTLQQSGILLHPDGEPVRSMIAPFVLSSTDIDSLERTLDLELMKCLHGNHIDLRAEVKEISALLRWGDDDRPSVETLIDEALRGCAEEDGAEQTKAKETEASSPKQLKEKDSKALVSPTMAKKFMQAVEHAIADGRVDERGVVELNGTDLLAARIGQVWLKSPKKWTSEAMYGAAAIQCGYPSYNLLDSGKETRRVILAPPGVDL